MTTNHEKYFLIGTVNKKNSRTPNNTIINNFTMYDTKTEAREKATQLLKDDKNLLKVMICYVSSVQSKSETINEID